MKPAISVILAVHNGQKYLVKAITSILNQSLADFEFIIIDDASIDDSLEIIKKFQKNDERIKLIINDRNEGLTKSLNNGLNLAQGEYIARMDADDISLPDRLKIQFNYLNNNPEIFLVGSSAYMIDNDGNLLGIKRVLSNPTKIRNRLLRTNHLIHPSVMFRNDGVTRYREKAFYCEDYDLYLQLLIKNRKLNNLKEPLIKYRVSLGSISFEKYFYAKLFLKKMREFFFQKVKTGKDDYDSFDPEEIFALKPPKNSKRCAEEQYINFLYELGNKKLLRSYSIKYLNKYGIVNKIIVYYLISYFPNWLLKR